MTADQVHGVVVIGGLFLVTCAVLGLACLLGSALEAGRRRREVEPRFAQVELARRAHVRVEAEQRRPAVVEHPRPRPAVSPPPMRRAS